MADHSKGTRRQVLGTLGLMWVAIAVGLTQTPQPRVEALLHTHIPLPCRVVLWGVPGAVAILAVWWQRLDRTAWGLLLVPPVERAGSFLLGWALGYPAGWIGALIYAALVFLVNRCAKGLDRPPSPIPLKEDPSEAGTTDTGLGPDSGGNPPGFRADPEERHRPHRG